LSSNDEIDGVMPQMKLAITPEIAAVKASPQRPQIDDSQMEMLTSRAPFWRKKVAIGLEPPREMINSCPLSEV
jgi:hypothetical protein